MTNVIKRHILNRRLGFRSGQEGIMRRYIRENTGWVTHLNSTKNFIKTALDDMKPDTVRLLGSGWLLDVPMDELLKKCQHIVLVDVAHPQQIIHKYQNNPKVEFQNDDLTGISNFLLKTPRKSINFFSLSNHVAHAKTPRYTEDLVVSLNLLSQLSDLTVPMLTKQLKLSNKQANELAKQIQANHMLSLPVGKSLIITDYEEEYRETEGQLLGTKPTVFVNMPHGNRAHEWDWRFDTHGTYREDTITTLKVMAIKL